MDVLLMFRSSIRSVDEERVVQMLFVIITHAIEFCSKMNSKDFDKMHIQNKDIVVCTTQNIEKSLELIKYVLMTYKFERKHNELHYKLSFLINICMDVYGKPDNYVRNLPKLFNSRMVFEHYSNDVTIMKTVYELIQDLGYSVMLITNINKDTLETLLKKHNNINMIDGKTIDSIMCFLQKYVCIDSYKDKPEDPLSSCVIFEPVLLPTCDEPHEKAFIMALLREKPENPYNRQNFSINEFNEYQASSLHKIEDYVKSNDEWFSLVEKYL